MKAETYDDWDRIGSDRVAHEKASSRRLWIFVGVLIALFVAVLIINYIEITMLIAAGESLPWMPWEWWWTLSIDAGIIVAVVIFLNAYLTRRCADIWTSIAYGIVLTLTVMFIVDDIIFLVWYAMNIPSASPDLAAILPLSIARNALTAAGGVAILVYVFTLLRDRKEECDIKYKGISVPAMYANNDEQTLAVQINCKELDGKKLCKIPKIESIK